MGLSKNSPDFGVQGARGWRGTSKSSALAQRGASGAVPVLSIIVLTLNSMEFVRECLESVPLDPRMEVVVVDGGSRDATVSTVRREFPWVRIHIAPGTGISRARNVGLRLGSGEYVLFLDSDDRMRADALETLLHCLETETPPFVVTHSIRINRAGERIGVRLAGYPDTYGGLLQNPVSTLGMACRRDVLLSLGGFSDRFLLAEDYDMWLRLFEVAQGQRLDVYLGEHRVRGDSRSQADVMRMRLFSARAALSAAKRRRTPQRLQIFLLGYWCLLVLDGLHLALPVSPWTARSVQRIGQRMRAQLQNAG
jgi:GT2 family glycosyltransferase